MADYDLNEIADALQARFQGVTMFQVASENVPLNVFSEVEGQVTAPAMVIALDDLDWDLTFARGSDSFTFLLSIMLQSADDPGGQRILRSALSTGGVGTRVKDVLEQDTTLGGLVSIAHLVGTRKVGTIEYSGLHYIGAELVLEVVAQ